MQCQRRLDEPGYSGGNVEMADVGLDRANAAVTDARRPTGTEGLCEAGNLDRIAQRSACAVRLDIGNRCRIDAGLRLRHGNDLRMAVHARRGETDFAAAVVVERSSLDDGVDCIAVLERIAQTA